MIKNQSIEVSDEELALKAKNGNEKALKELGERYQKGIVKICMFQMKFYNNSVSEEDIYDVANRVLLKMLTKIETYDRNKGKLKTWLKRIAK